MIMIVRLGIVCDVTWPTKLSSHEYIYKLMFMKNIRVLSFSLYPPYANSPKNHERDLAIGNRGTFMRMSLGQKMGNTR